MSATGDVLELEHVIGYTGRSAHNIHCHPKRLNEFVCRYAGVGCGCVCTCLYVCGVPWPWAWRCATWCPRRTMPWLDGFAVPHGRLAGHTLPPHSLGANVVVGDIEDPHRQEFLRAHDEEVSALMLSSSGLLIASGQHGSTRSPVRHDLLRWPATPAPPPPPNLVPHINLCLRLPCLIVLVAGSDGASGGVGLRAAAADLQLVRHHTEGHIAGVLPRRPVPGRRRRRQPHVCVGYAGAHPALLGVSSLRLCRPRVQHGVVLTAARVTFVLSHRPASNS